MADERAAAAILYLPPEEGPITTLHAWIAVQTDGSGEGLMSAIMGGTHMPLLSSRLHVVKTLEASARNIEKASGGKIRAELRTFHAVAHMEE
jgi:hypothetical protein